jgi:hypothetical protein
MLRRGIDRQTVEAALDRAHAIEIGPTAVIYDGDVDGRPLRVVVVRRSRPGLVITVHDRDD